MNTFHIYKLYVEMYYRMLPADHMNKTCNDMYVESLKY